jgi:hypothetical protein
MTKQSRHYRRVRSVTLLLSMAAALALSASAFAQRDHAGVRPHARGDISRFHQSDRNWTHVRHGGWRVTGGIWLGYPLVYPYPYAYPYTYSYPYPSSYAWGPPVESAVPAVPPPAQYWYFCEALNTYYPYVASCPGGWRAVPATPRDASPVPQQ